VNIKKLLCMIVLFIVQSNFCMEDQERKSRVEVLDDGHEWMIIENEEDFGPYAGNLVACRSSVEEIRRYQSRYRHPESSDFYVFITNSPISSPIYCARSHREVKDCSSAVRLCRSWSADDEPIAAVRLLTRKEVRYFKAPSKEILYPQAPEDTCFTLSNLMEKERKPHFWNRVQKNIWTKQRLLHIGAKDPGSALCGTPKDIVRKIAWHVIDAEANEKMAEAKLDDLLVLE